MDRRDTIRTILLGSLAGGALLGANACKTDAAETAQSTPPLEVGVGRTPWEAERDSKLMADQFFNEHEMATMAVLCDLILPKDEVSGSATDAGVPDFIEFIAKDMEYHQLPLRGGFMWLDSESNGRFGVDFKDAAAKQQTEILDDIAYGEEKAKPELIHGVKFFNLIRNLTITGFYTTEMGIKDVGYQGNIANLWDGVPDEVLKGLDVAYEEEWLAKCVNQERRLEIAEWDEEGNLLNN